jgi:predicted transcriptional regulator
LSNLREWIKQELTVDFENELSKHKEKVKALLQLTPSGQIFISRLDLTAKQRIIAYMVGKVYAEFAKYSDDGTVTNKELMDALHMPEGTVKYTLHELRNEGIIISKDGMHQIKIEQIGVALDRYFGGINEP